jgi:prevent-host-death family protein
LQVAAFTGLRPWEELVLMNATIDSQSCITRDTIRHMAEVSIRDLRNHGGDVVDRAARGEQITITRSGKPVAELRAISPRGLSAEALLSRWRRLPSVDPVVFREDVDRLLDSSL